MSDTEKVLAPTLQSGGKPLAIVPQTFDDCYRMGQLLAASGLVPADYKGKPEACTVAIMQGLELGLSPMAAVQSIAVINGRPSIWGDGALAVVRASGLLESIEETSDDTKATCRVKRKGEPFAVERSFTMDDAQKAGLKGKAGPWQQYPKRMLQMRARSWCLRDVFADVLKGMHIAEESQDVDLMKDITPRPALADIPDMPAIADIPETQTETETDAPIADEAGLLAMLETEFAAAGADIANRQEVWDSNEHLIGRLSTASRAIAEKWRPVAEAAE